MNYNPFKQKVNHLYHKLEHSKSKKQILSDELNWFDSNNATDLFISLDCNNKLKSQIDILDQEISQLLKDIEEIKRLMETDISQRWVLHGLKIELTTKQKLNKKMQKALKDIEIEKYQNFNRQKVIEDINSLDKEIVLLEESYRIASDLSNKATITLQPVVDKINELESIISAKTAKINKALSFDKELSSVTNAFERAKIHNECEEMLGEGSPRKIKKQLEEEIRPIKRDLNKAKKRAVSIVKKITRTVNKLVIDGNNMCYEGDKFVGLSPLIKLTNELQDKYSIVIVFDSTIRRLLKSSNQEIQKLFDNNIKVHIVATMQSADETILEITSDDVSCHILSNDRFSEYPEKEAVKNNRLIRHEIVGNKLIIHDLDINLKYTNK